MIPNQRCIFHIIDVNDQSTTISLDATDAIISMWSLLPVPTTTEWCCNVCRDYARAYLLHWTCLFVGYQLTSMDGLRKKKMSIAIWVTERPATTTGYLGQPVAEKEVISCKFIPSPRKCQKMSEIISHQNRAGICIFIELVSSIWRDIGGRLFH